jgi:hypothetical protein
VSGLYQLPFGKSRGPLQYLVRDWQLSGIFSTQTGQPFTVTSSTDPAAPIPPRVPTAFATARCRRISATLITGSISLRSPTQTCACFGNSGRNILRGPGFMNLDSGVSRNFAIGERFRIEFRAEFFNLMNHPNFGIPGVAIGNQTAGIICTVVNPERQNQLAMKLRF